MVIKKKVAFFLFLFYLGIVFLGAKSLLIKVPGALNKRIDLSFKKKWNLKIFLKTPVGLINLKRVKIVINGDEYNLFRRWRPYFVIFPQNKEVKDKTIYLELNLLNKRLVQKFGLLNEFLTYWNGVEAFPDGKLNLFFGDEIEKKMNLLWKQFEGECQLTFLFKKRKKIEFLWKEKRQIALISQLYPSKRMFLLSNLKKIIFKDIFNKIKGILKGKKSFLLVQQLLRAKDMDDFLKFLKEKRVYQNNFNRKEEIKQINLSVYIRNNLSLCFYCSLIFVKNISLYLKDLKQYWKDSTDDYFRLKDMLRFLLEKSLFFQKYSYFLKNVVRKENKLILSKSGCIKLIDSEGNVFFKREGKRLIIPLNEKNDFFIFFPVKAEEEIPLFIVYPILNRHIFSKIVEILPD